MDKLKFTDWSSVQRVIGCKKIAIIRWIRMIGDILRQCKQSYKTILNNYWGQSLYNSMKPLKYFTLVVCVAGWVAGENGIKANLSLSLSWILVVLSWGWAWQKSHIYILILSLQIWKILYGDLLGSPRIHFICLPWFYSCFEEIEHLLET